EAVEAVARALCPHAFLEPFWRYSRATDNYREQDQLDDQEFAREWATTALTAALPHLIEQVAREVEAEHVQGVNYEENNFEAGTVEGLTLAARIIRGLAS